MDAICGAAKKRGLRVITDVQNRLYARLIRAARTDADRLITFERERRMNPEALRLLPEGGGWLVDTPGIFDATRRFDEDAARDRRRVVGLDDLRRRIPDGAGLRRRGRRG